ncbi:M43 family zinc metalloprotease [Phaeodactylibacter sp.]|uniref:M43 family zinc metalloprotease n=1 Tax=Phaeodactylibacter sp. TaxID=1940289 RepID=UPI0025E87558|nr:M43 family zinc metalloprotease [Phaeodactylibacter sp.]MCI4650440.1 M43 family zinc metalloprotease [Phaeodactylibacter sp.]MCI5093846.1 M43 family zinc metalloprotease [Phaeodactylibacter sp.]
MKTPYPLLFLKSGAVLCGALAFLIITAPSAAGQKTCAQSLLHERLMVEDAAYRQRHLAFEERLADKRSRISGSARSNDELLVLPVVFHIIQSDDQDPVPDAQMQQALQHLNDAFANTGYYNAAQGSNTYIQFCMAQRTPDNLPSTGVERVTSPLAVMEGLENDIELKNLSRYEPLHYINIWAVEDVCLNGNCNVTGYANLPGTHGQDRDGIVVDIDYIGTSPDSSSLLAHEMGHYLGLYHTFEGGCENDNCLFDGDRVCDTPPDQTTAKPPCDQPDNSCFTDTVDVSDNNPFRPLSLGGLGDQPDDYRNHMDYSRLECGIHFTPGQIERMRLSAPNQRQSLLSSFGCRPPCPAPVTADFAPLPASVPLNAPIPLENLSTNADTYVWYLNDSLISTAANPVWTPGTLGPQQLQLVAMSGDTLCQPAVFQQQVTVFCPVVPAFTPTDTTVLVGATLNFENTSTGANAYRWFLQDSLVSTGDSYIFSSSTPGFYEICLEASTGLCAEAICNRFQVQGPYNGGPCENTFITSVTDTFTNEVEFPHLTDIEFAPDGGLYFSGYVGSSFFNSQNSFISKVNPDGQIGWTRQIDIDPDLRIFQITPSENGIIACSGNGFNYGFNLMEINTQTGNIDWAERWWAGPDTTVLIQNITPLENSDSYWLAGYYNIDLGNNNYLQRDFYGKYNSHTNSLDFIRSFNYYENAYTIDISGPIENAVLLNEHFYQTVHWADSTSSNVILEALQPDGTILFSKEYLPQVDSGTTYFPGAMLATEDALFLTGTVATENILGSETLIIKLTPNGEVIWSKSYSSESLLYLQGGSSLSQKANGNILLGSQGASGTIENPNNFHAFIEIDPDGIPVEAVKVDNTTLSDNHFYTFYKLLHRDSTTTFVTINEDLSFEIRKVYEDWTGCTPFLPLAIESEDVAAEVIEHQPTLEDVPLECIPITGSTSPFYRNHEVTCYFEPAPCPQAEICDNGLDDNFNGLTDCEDEACPCSADCGQTFVQLLDAGTGATTLVQGNNGDFYLGGHAGEAAAITRATLAGSIVWQYTFDLSPGADRIVHLRPDGSGLLLGGAIGQAGDERWGTLFKYDPVDNALLWSTTLPLGNNGSLRKIALNPENGHLFFTGSLGQGNTTAGLLGEVDTGSGALLWHRQLAQGDQAFLEGLTVVGSAIYATGQAGFENGPGSARPVNAAFTLTGAEVWSRQYLAPPGVTAQLSGRAIAPDATGLISAFQGAPAGTDAQGEGIVGLYKTDFSGNLVWGRAFEVPGYTALQPGLELVRAQDGFLLSAVGQGESQDLLLLKIDAEGNPQWARKYGLPDQSTLAFADGGGNRILQTGSSIYLVGTSIDAGGTENALFIRTNLEGDVLEGECTFTAPVTVNATDWEVLHEEAYTAQALPHSFDPTISQPEPGVGSLGNTFLCSPPTCEDLCVQNLVLEVDSVFCNGDSLRTRIRICNSEAGPFFGALPVTYYDGDPQSGAVAIDSFVVQVDSILNNRCDTLWLDLPYPSGTGYLVLNDNGSTAPPFDPETAFAGGAIIECTYLDNLAPLPLQRTAPVADLGPDQEACENATVVLSPGNFDEYLWQDGSTESTYTIFDAGTFWVEVTNRCALSDADTIQVTYTDPVVLRADPAVGFLCPEDTVQLSAEALSGYTVEWSPAGSLSCTNCTTPLASPDSTTLYVVTSENGEGCASVDSITLSLIPCDQTLDTVVCANDSLLLENSWFLPGDTDTLTDASGALQLIRVAPIDTQLVFLDTLACAAGTIDYAGTTLAPDTTALFTFTNAEGCDSTVALNVGARPPITGSSNLQICAGDTATVFGLPQTEAGTYAQTFASVTGCDSVHTLTLTVVDTPSVQLDDARLDCTTLTGELEGSPFGGTPPYAYTWSNGPTTASNTELMPGLYTITITDANDCSNFASATVLDELPQIALSVLVDSASCFGTPDGQITVSESTGGTPPYAYRLNDGDFSEDRQFDNLEAGVYTLSIRDVRGCLSDTQIVIGSPPELLLALPADTTLELGQTVELAAQVSGGSDLFEWSPPDGLDCTDCPNPIAQPVETTTYQLLISTLEGCTTAESITIIVERPRKLYIPNVFSPNGDGRNDVFRVFPGPGVQQIVQSQIFDRWGGLVFEAGNYTPDATQPTWDGTVGGNLMSSGVFTYTIEVLFIDGQVERFSGSVLLLR